jgi:hypothetical protein
LGVQWCPLKKRFSFQWGRYFTDKLDNWMHFNASPAPIN